MPIYFKVQVKDTAVEDPMNIFATSQHTRRGKLTGLFHHDEREMGEITFRNNAFDSDIYEQGSATKMKEYSANATLHKVDNNILSSINNNYNAAYDHSKSTSYLDILLHFYFK